MTNDLIRVILCQVAVMNQWTVPLEWNIGRKEGKESLPSVVGHTCMDEQFAVEDHQQYGLAISSCGIYRSRIKLEIVHHVSAE